MCARFTVLSDTPIAAAIAGCAIPLSRNSTIWMRWRCAAGIFHRSAVFSRRTSALLHLTIRSPESDGPSESHLKRGIQPVQAVSCIIRTEPIHAVMELVISTAFSASSRNFDLNGEGQDGQNETEQPDHSANLGDSITSSTRTRFSVRTGSFRGV